MVNSATVTPVVVSKEDALQILKDARNQQVKKYIDESTVRAAEVLHEVMDSNDAPPIVRVTAAKDILDRGGHKPVEKVQMAVVFPKPILDLDAIAKEHTNA